MVRLKDFLDKCAVDEAGLTEAYPDSLLTAELLSIKARKPKAFAMRLRLNKEFPDGNDIYKLESLLAQVCAVHSVELTLEAPENQASMANETALREAIIWLSNTLEESEPILAHALCATEPEALASGAASIQYALTLSPLAFDKLTSDKQEMINRFINERAGLESKLVFFCQKIAETEAASELETYLQNIQARYNEKQEQLASVALENQSTTAGHGVSKNGFETKNNGNRNSDTKAIFVRKKKLPNLLWGRMYEVKETTPLNELHADSGIAQFEGKVKKPEFVETRAGNKFKVSFNLEDTSGAISCIMFVKPEEQEELQRLLKKGTRIRVEAELSFDDRYTHDLQAKVFGFMAAEEKSSQRRDLAPMKRIELHAHTKLSAKDALADPKKLVKMAAEFGHQAVAITDHGVVQAFPDACAAADELKAQGKDIKLIYGMEGYLVDDGNVCVYGLEPFPQFKDFVAIDVETTGLDANQDRLIEVAALRFTRNETGEFTESERYQSLVQPGLTLPAKITELTGLTDIDLLGQPDAALVIEKLHAFIGDSPVVAHNALFDLGFIRAEAFRTRSVTEAKLKFNPCLIDTLQLARSFVPGLERYSLDKVAGELGIKLEQHHRAEDDARCSALVFIELYQRLGQPTLEKINEAAGKIDSTIFMAKKYPVHHIIILAATSLGMYHLYRLVSESHVRYINARPRIPRSLLDYLRQGLLLGAACEAGEVFRMVRQAYVSSGRDFLAAQQALQRKEHKKTARYYDYLEIQPLCNNRFLLNSEHTGILFEDDLIKMNQLVIKLAESVKKPVVASCDVHFLNKEDDVYRKMMLSNMGYADAAMQADLYFRTTEEMLAEFAYLGRDEAERVVVHNPQSIAERINDQLRPFPQGSFPPEMPEAEREVTEMCYGNAKAIYDAGKGLPDVVEQRIKRELDSIITHGFAIMYYISHKVVKKSNDDGYLVGSRGSVGSSLVATLCGITEVNPLPPHYYCKSCKYSEFDTSGTYGSGYDLPEKNCPICEAALAREGQDIPFETFLGFNGDKQPDIDLNFSGDYQSRAHLFIEEMFGQEFTFRAGTIGAYAEKNAEGLVRNYLESIDKVVPKAEIERLASAFVGVKRTTGQHPGGIVVIPKDREIYDFTPVQYPADNQSSLMQTTHFDFNALHETILKLDILGHDDPTVLHMLTALTGVDVLSIPIPDPDVMAMFRSTDPLKFTKASDQDASTLGIPEMGTMMARDMIAETQPSRFYDLVQLMGLSHGTDVWKGNAQDLIREGICDINNVIGCRDSIMTTLIYKGLPSKDAFDIMEKVRKGRGLNEEHEALMRENQVEEWYIDSCKKIKYMFPKAHAVAYAISSLRVAWFKVHRPAAYYSAYFTVRADEFDSSLMCVGLEQVMVNRRHYKRLMQERGASPKDKNSFYILELVEEMHNRGIKFAPIDLMESDATDFIPLSDTLIRPPLNVIPGISSSMANTLTAAREADGAFHNKEELARRAQLGPVAITALEEAGVLHDLPDSAQLDFFDLLAGT